MRRRWVWIALGVAAVVVVVAVLLLVGGSNPGPRTARLPGLTLTYPGHLQRESPIPGEQMVFLAEAVPAANTSRANSAQHFFSMVICSKWLLELC